MALACGAQLGCLHDEAPPVGTKLLAGHGYRSPFVRQWPDGTPRVVFESPAATTRFGEVQGWNLDAIPLAGGEHQVLATNIEEGLSWDANNHLYIRHGSSLVGDRTVASIRRIDLLSGAFVDIPDALDLSVDYGTGRFCYQRLTTAMADAGQRPELHFNDGTNVDAVVGTVTGSMTMISGELWLILGENRTLTHVTAPGAEPDAFVSSVESFWPRWGATGSLSAVISTRPTEGTAVDRKLMDLDLTTRAMVELPATGAVSVIGYSADATRFLYTESKTDGSLLHLYDLTGQREDTLLVQPGVDIVRTIVRPVTGEVLYADGNGSLFFVDPAAPARLSPLYVTVRREQFSEDGKRMFATVVGLSGSVTVLNADELLAGRITGFPLVPSGMKVSRFVPVNGGDQVVFWGSYGESVPDLYIVDTAPGASLKLLAPRVDLLNTNLVTLVGMVRSSPQDGLSDLVKLNLETGAEKLFARSVSDFALYSQCEGCDYLDPGASLVYIVNARTPSERDGIWVTTL